MTTLRASAKITLLASGLCCFACGGSGAKPKTSADDIVIEHEPDDGLEGVSVSSEIGGLNQEAVDRAFSKSLKDLRQCLNRGAQEVEFLGGDVSFFVKVSEDGQLRHSHLEESTLGHRDTELCMLQALGKQSWPKPVGGQTGLARKSFSFDMPNDVRPPTEWTQESVEETLDELSEEMNSCKSAANSYTVTMYVDTDGSVMAAGVAHTDDAGEQAADCLVTALKAAKFPSPGSWPAKVSIKL
jgi:hypothetical protein